MCGSHFSRLALVLLLGAASCGSDGTDEPPFGGQYTVKTAIASTTCDRIVQGQGNTHTATVTQSGDSVTIGDSSGLSLTGSLSGQALAATGTISVPVSDSCTTSNTVSLDAQVPDNLTIRGTARIQIQYPASCGRLSARTCTADLLYEATKPDPDLPDAPPAASTIPSGTLLWGNPVRLGNTGTYPAVEFDSSGKGHALYRREKNVYYRFFDGTRWGSEVRVNDDGSRTESEIKDRNLPKVTVDDRGNAYLLWGGDLPTLFIYLRVVSPQGQFTTPITEIRITDVLPSMGGGGGKQPERPEETALSFSNADKKLHVSAVYIGDSDLIPYDQRRDGVYDMIVDPATLRVERAERVGLASKNLYTVNGPQTIHGFFRLNVPVYFRYEGGSYTKTTPGLPSYRGNLGALNLWSSDDTNVAFTAVSTYPINVYTDRDLSYARFNPSDGGRLLEAVSIDQKFHSPIGIVPILVMPGGQVFIAYDDTNLDLNGPVTNPLGTIQQVVFAWRAGGSAFTGPGSPFLWPGRIHSLGEAPAIARAGEAVHVVWNGKSTSTFDAVSATFQP